MSHNEKNKCNFLKTISYLDGLFKEINIFIRVVKIKYGILLLSEIEMKLNNDRNLILIECYLFLLKL